MKNEIQILRKRNEDLKKKEDKINQEIKKIEEKYKISNEEKIKIINDLKSKLNRNITQSNKLLDGEKLIALNFISVDQRINHTVICKNKTDFHIVEAQLYEKYPEYKDSDNFFMFNGNKINRWKNLEDYGIHEYTIMLKKIEE